MYYYWLSFSKAVREGEPGNLGAVLLTSEVELSQDAIIEKAREQNFIPALTFSIMGCELDEEDALAYPLNQFMTRNELMARDDVEDRRDPIDICDDCLNGSHT